MISKEKEIIYPYDSAGVYFVVFLYMGENGNFDKSLLNELL